MATDVDADSPRVRQERARELVERIVGPDHHHDIDYALTLALAMRIFNVERGDGNWDLWGIAEVARNGDVLAWRLKDEPHQDMPGVAYYKWWPSSVLAFELQRKWDDDRGWE
jgi:hypothetical protein